MELKDRRDQTRAMDDESSGQGARANVGWLFLSSTTMGWTRENTGDDGKPAVSFDEAFSLKSLVSGVDLNGAPQVHCLYIIDS